MRRKSPWLAALFLLILVLSLPWLLNLDAFEQRVHRALEQQLGRSVEFSSLTARLLPRPGIVGRKVIVHERPDFGAEPFLYADEFSCNLSLSTLWAMPLECSEIQFLRPSINLVRRPDGAWNLAAFLLLGEVATDAPPRPPTISATQARINFKLGVDKQVYALRAGRLRLAPLSAGRWRLELQATPLRTDRRLPEIGELRLEGNVGYGPEFSALPFRFQVSLERGSLAQWWALVSGREPPVRALASFSASLEGTPADWKARGTFGIANLRRWDVVAPSRTPLWQSEFALRYVTDKPALELQKLMVRAQQSEVLIKGRVEDLLGHRRWDLEVEANRIEFAELMAQWAALKADVPPQARLEGVGQLTLVLRGLPESWQGEFTVPEGIRMHVPGRAQPVQSAILRASLERGRVELEPLALAFSPAHTLTVEGELDSLSRLLPYRLRWESAGVELDALRRTAAALGWDLFGPTRWQGLAELHLEWHGQLRGEGTPRWQGEVNLREVKYEAPEFNGPLELLETRLLWRRRQVETRPIVFRLGKNTVTGTLGRRGRVGRWKVDLEAERLDLDDLDQLLNPRRRDLLSRLVGPQRQDSRWQQLSAGGRLRIGELTAGPFTLRQLEARAELQSGWLELAQLRFRGYKGRFDGRLQVDFRASPPRYRLAGNLKQVDVAELLAQTTQLGDLYTGVLGADLTIETAGKRPHELLRQLQGRVVGVLRDGSVVHLNLFSAMADAAGLEAPDGKDSEPTPLQSLAGEFRLSDQQVELDGARIITSRAALELSGSVGFDSRLDLRLHGEPLRVAGRRPTLVADRALSFSYRLTGTLRDPVVERAEPLPSPAPPSP